MTLCLTVLTVMICRYALEIPEDLNAEWLQYSKWFKNLVASNIADGNNQQQDLTSSRSISIVCYVHLPLRRQRIMHMDSQLKRTIFIPACRIVVLEPSNEQLTTSRTIRFCCLSFSRALCGYELFHFTEEQFCRNCW